MEAGANDQVVFSELNSGVASEAVAFTVSKS